MHKLVHGLLELSGQISSKDCETGLCAIQSIQYADDLIPCQLGMLDETTITMTDDFWLKVFTLADLWPVALKRIAECS